MPKNDKQRWADEEEEEDNQQILASNKSGIQERIKYTVNSKGQNVKITTKVRVKEYKIRVPLRVNSRKNLPRFGEAKIGEENVTLPSRDFVSIEHPDDQTNDDSADPTLQKTLANFISKKQERELTRDYNDYDDLDEEEVVVTESSSSNVAKYVAPGGGFGSRGGGGDTGGGQKDKDNGYENTLRVSNLTKLATEEDLGELFSRFGKIHRISLPRVDTTKEPKGYAYIAFARHADAEEALNKLQNHGYDHLILKLEWAKPPKENTSTEDRYRQGYGKQLVQDTKEKVLYASNLTGNN